MERHPWLLRLRARPSRSRPRRPGSRSRSRSASRSWAGSSSGLLAYLVRSSDTLVDVDCERRRSGESTTPRSGRRDALQLVTELGGTSVVVAVLDLVAVRRVPPRPEQVGARLPRDRRRRRDPPREHGQGAPRPRASDVQPHRRDARAVVPERPLRDWRRRSTQRPRSSSRASARRGRARCSRAAPWRSPSASPAAASCSASTGCPTSSPASPSAGRGSASARSRSAAGSSCSARRSSRPRRSPSSKWPASGTRPRTRKRRAGQSVVEPALQRADAAGGRRRETPGSFTSRCVSGSPLLEQLELLGRIAPPVLVDTASSGRRSTVLDRRARGAPTTGAGASRARRSRSSVTTFISVSLKSECALRFAEPTVSQRSSTIPIFEWT